MTVEYSTRSTKQPFPRMLTLSIQALGTCISFRPFSICIIFYWLCNLFDLKIAFSTDIEGYSIFIRKVSLGISVKRKTASNVLRGLDGWSKISRLNLSPLEEKLRIKLEKNTQNSKGQIYGFFSLNSGLLLNKSCF